MTAFPKPVRAGVLLVGFAFALLQSSYAQVGQEIRQGPKLVLVLAIDQMHFDYLTRFDDLYEGGLRTLIDEGAVFTNARYRHAGTWTGPGHAVMLSGRHPSSSGIVFNQWYDSLLEREANVVEDRFYELLGGPGFGASPANFIGFTVGDVLKRSSPESKLVGVSLKDDAAILMAGRFPDAAYWYDDQLGKFVTSTYYMDELPEWLSDWNRDSGADSYAEREWTRLLEDDSLYESHAGPDAAQGEWRDAVFPHRFQEDGSKVEFYSEFGWTPFADEITLDVSLEAMVAHELGADEYTDILAISFSGPDRTGHRYGPRSQEVMDGLLRLDSHLKELLVRIDEEIGMESVVVVMTADHGVLPLVETLQAEGFDARRANPSMFRNAVDAALDESFGDATGFVS
jgi:predicted AlkP superfamily pyrophosphatase or phosphodiesterase